MQQITEAHIARYNVVYPTLIIVIYNYIYCLVPSGLLALQGNDEEGRFIRSKLQNMGVTTEFIKG